MQPSFGLKMHLGKTKVMTQNGQSKKTQHLDVQGQRVPVLDETSSEKYLGCKVSLCNRQQIELDNRFAAAWAAFHKHKNELCNKSYHLQDRLRLFEATVTPTLLYASSTWAMTKHQESSLQVLRRRMLRYVCRIHRKRDQQGALESWIVFLQRVATQTGKIAEKYGLDDWIVAYRRRKWRFAGRTARQTDQRWSTRLLSWIPVHGYGRLPGRPLTRWADDITQYAGGNWTTSACDKTLWSMLEYGFIHSHWK